MKRWNLWIMSFLLLSVIALPTMEAHAQEMDAEAAPTITQIVTTDSTFSTLATAVQAAGLAEALDGDGPFTVFAPTNDAFAALPEGTLGTLLNPENKDQLVRILQYHVVPATAMAADVQTMDEAETLAGAPVAFTIADGVVMVENATVTTADVEAANGVIHVIDTVLMPPAKAEKAQ